MNTDKFFKVNEIFFSIQGESMFTGKPTIFLRFTGCPFNCSYCDTAYAFTEGSQLTSNSRTYRMSMYMPNNIQLSNVIVDANKTTTTANVTGLDTTIPVTDATKLDNPSTVIGVGEIPGVVYIGSERIEYCAVS